MEETLEQRRTRRREEARRYRAKLKSDPTRRHIYARMLEKARIQQRQHRKNRGPEIRARESQYQKDWTRKFPEKRRQAKRKELARLRTLTIAAYGSRCACCGEHEEKFLQLDHINGDGAEKRQAVGGLCGIKYYRLLRRAGWPSGYRMLCANCHQAISSFGGCPHGLPSNKRAKK